MSHGSIRSKSALTIAVTAAALAVASCSGKPIFVDELVVTDIKVGDGKELTTRGSVSVHYTGWLYDWTKKGGRGARFDSSYDRGVPFTFLPGGGGVIKGWEQGVVGMKVGGIRELLIPAELAYGDKVAAGGKIPANSDLIFEIELMIVRD